MPAPLPKTAFGLVYPAAIEARYWRMLRAHVLEVQRLYLEALERGLKGVGGSIDARAERGDSATSDASQLLRVMEEVQIPAMSPAELMAISSSVDRQVAGELMRTVGRSLEMAPWRANQVGMYQGWARANASLVTNMDLDMTNGIRDRVMTAVHEGKSTRQLAKEIQAQTKVSSSRARLIARDQVGKMTGAVQEVRQRSLGITEYIWRASIDDRTRDSHADLDGTTQKWSDPPFDGNENVHPGWAINCRCTAESVIPSIEEAAAMGGATEPPTIGPDMAYQWQKRFDPAA